MSNSLSDIQIPVAIGGVTFKNPFYVASGPTTKTVEQLVRIEETGWAAASIKLSIDPAPYINRRPRYGVFADRNALAFTAEKRLTFLEGLDLIRSARPKLHDLKLMANITYAGDSGVDGWINMAKQFEEAGADIIELNLCCPNMSYNLELTSGGEKTASRQTGASMGQNPDVAAEVVSAVKRAISIPLFVKLTPEGGRIAQVAKILRTAGADAVGSAGNRLGLPPIELEQPEKSVYHLQDEISMSCYCGGWLKPLALRDTYEIFKTCGRDLPIMATGGIQNWKDAVEMVLCGGSLLGVCTETLLSGYDICRPMIRETRNYMERHGYHTLEEFRGILVGKVKSASDVTLHAGYARIREPNLSAPCKSACPCHVPVQAYIQKIAKGEYRQAYDLITGSSALQSLCALVCTRPCEDGCVRGSIDAPVKIRELKRFVLDYGRRKGWKPIRALSGPNGHKVAVIGAGLCGLSCATELVKAGYDVTVMEREASAGGLLRYGLPNYAGHRTILDEEIEELCSCGVKFEFGRNISDANELRKEGYERVFSAVGANSIASPSQHGTDAREFLFRLNSGEKLCVGRRVIVIGGTPSAWNAARSAVRLGAESVVLLQPGKASGRRDAREVMSEAQEEGVAVLDCAKVTGTAPGLVRFVRDGAEFQASCDELIVDNVYETLHPNGDADFLVKPDRKIDDAITAITAGKNAAALLDHQIRGGEAVLQAVGSVKTVNAETVRRRSECWKRDAHPISLMEDAAKRRENFDPCRRVMTQEEAMREAARCLNCGCGEGCQLCKTICASFAPECSGADALQISAEKCVACGVCAARCPNGNIEMVQLGTTV